VVENDETVERLLVAAADQTAAEKASADEAERAEAKQAEVVQAAAEKAATEKAAAEATIQHCCPIHQYENTAPREMPSHVRSPHRHCRRRRSKMEAGRREVGGWRLDAQ
jgi:hypothetical protein